MEEKCVSLIRQDGRRFGDARVSSGLGRTACARDRAEGQFRLRKVNWGSQMMIESLMGRGTRSTRFGARGVAGILVALLFLLTGSALSQGFSFYGQIVDQTGKPAGFSQLRVCANSGGGAPCNPLTTLYSDSALTHQIPNPFTTDSRGNYTVFVASGYYILQFSVAGSGMYSYVASAQVGTGGNNLTPNAVQFAIDTNHTSAATGPQIVAAFSGPCNVPTNVLLTTGLCGPVTGTAGNPAGAPQDVQFAGVGTFAADTGKFGYTTGSHTLDLTNLDAINQFVPLGITAQAISATSQNYQGTNSSGLSGTNIANPWNAIYTQTQRVPGGTNAFLSNITVNAWNGEDNSLAIANNMTALTLALDGHQDMQVGGLFQMIVNCLGNGDCIYETMLHTCSALTRGTDEGCGWLNREFHTFQVSNFGGNITQNTPDATGQIFATFAEPTTGPYPNDWELRKAVSGQVVVDFNTRTAIGNLIGEAITRGGTSITLQTDTNHGMGVSTNTFLTAPILSLVYSDACGVGQTGTSWSASGGVITLNIANSYSVGQHFSIEGMQDGVGFQLNGGSYVAAAGTNSTTIVVTTGTYFAGGDLSQFPPVSTFPNTATVTEAFKTVRTTGQQYPTTGPNINSGDGFSTLPNGQGLGTINANYLNDTSNTLVGYCMSVASTAGFSATSPNDYMFVSDIASTAEYPRIKQIVDGTHILATFVHSRHPYGSPVTTGGGVHQGVTMDADLLPPRTLDTSEWAQFAPAMLTYPIISTPDSTHIEIFTQTAGSNELLTLGYAGNTPTTPMTSIVLTITGGVATGITSFTNPNNYTASPNMSGGSPYLPAPGYTITGCTVPPTLKFLLTVTGGATGYVPSIATGGSGCSSPVVTLNNTYSNPIFKVATTYSRSIINPAIGVPCQYPGDTGSVGCELLDYMPPGLMPNGDLVAQEFNAHQYVSGNQQYSGSIYTQTSQRFGQSTQIQYQNIQPTAFLYIRDISPETQFYGTPAHNFAPASPSEGRVAPAKVVEFGGANSGVLFDMPPMTGYAQINNRYNHGNGPGYGGDAFTWGCIDNFLTNFPCQVGQFDEFGVFNFFFNTFLSYNLNDSTMRLYTGNFLVPGTANYIGAPTIIMPDTLGGSQAGLHNAAGIVTFDGSLKGDGEGNIGGAGTQFDQYIAGVNLSTGSGSGGVVGAPGTCATSYEVTATTRGGAGESPFFVFFNFSNSPNAPNSSNYAFSTVITPVVGATGYNTYRITDGCGHTAPARICTNIPLAAMMTNTGCKDVGQAGTAGSPPTVDTTGSLIFNGSAPIVGLAGAGNLLQTASSGPPYLSTGTTSNEDLAGHIAMTGSAVTYTFQNTLTAAPNCVVSGQAHPVTYTVSSTTLTMTGTSADTANWVCIGTTP